MTEFIGDLAIRILGTALAGTTDEDLIQPPKPHDIPGHKVGAYI